MNSTIPPIRCQHEHDRWQIALDKLVDAMTAQSCWDVARPDPEAMASTAPFGCDLMTLPQWLRYVFIPKIQALIFQAGEMPKDMAILPYAQEVLAEKREVCLAIADIDALAASMRESDA